jgi:hypothetical protein
MDSLFEGLTITDYHDDFNRNIVSIRESQDLFDDLTESPEGWKAAIDLEISTKPYPYISEQGIIDRPFEEAEFNQAIQYPFDHWSKSRYSDGSFGVWYGAVSLETSVHETIYHWRNRLLEDAGWHTIEGVISERKVYRVSCDAGLLNFLLKIDKYPALLDPSPNGCHLTHQVGARINHDGHPGLISQSARCDGNVCAIFNRKVLSNPRQVCFLTYRTEGSSVVVERTPGDVLMILDH